MNKKRKNKTGKEICCFKGCKKEVKIFIRHLCHGHAQQYYLWSKKSKKQRSKCEALKPLRKRKSNKK